MATNTEPAWYQDWLKNEQTVPTPVLTVSSPENNIVFNSGPTEMLRIAEDGFYVRGVKLKQDDKEIKEVYNCFKEWLTWSTLNRN